MQISKPLVVNVIFSSHCRRTPCPALIESNSAVIWQQMCEKVSSVSSHSLPSLSPAPISTRLVPTRVVKADVDQIGSYLLQNLQILMESSFQPEKT